MKYEIILFIVGLIAATVAIKYSEDVTWGESIGGMLCVLSMFIVLLGCIPPSRYR